MEDKEVIWKDIPGFDGKYQASSDGRIRSFARGTTKILTPESRHKGARGAKGSVVGIVRLRTHGKQLCHSVQRLMAITFIGPPPTEEHICKMINPNAELTVDNIHWVEKSYHPTHHRDMCNRGHPLLTENDYYKRIFETTGEKRCKVCHRENSLATARRKNKGHLRVGM